MTPTAKTATRYGHGCRPTLPADVKILRIKVNDRLTIQYAIKATPTIYLLDKNNIVTLKDCTPEQLVKQFK